MHLLVTGGCGFIGSHFVEHVIESTDHKVTTLDLLTYAGSEGNLEQVADHPNHELVVGDIRDYEFIANVIEGVDCVVNFAAQSHVDRSIDDSNEFVSTNVLGTQVLLTAAREEGIDRFLQISTDEVYGEVINGTAREGDRLSPRNPYAATKAGADLLIGSFYTTYDMPAIIVRPSNNFGPRQHQEKFIPKMITKARRGENLPVYGDGENVREWTYVTDNCRAILTVLREGNPGEVYNVGSGERKTNKDVAEAIVSMVGGSESQIEFVNDRPGHDLRYALDSGKIADLGWQPEFTFEKGLRQTADYYLGI